LCASVQATKFIEVRTVDSETIMIHWIDGKVTYPDDGKGETAFMGHESRGADTIELFNPPLDGNAAKRTSSYAIRSITDTSYSQAVRPTSVSRRAKVTGTAWDWPEPKWALEHTVFLRLSKPLKSGTRYTVSIDGKTGSDKNEVSFVYDQAKSISEALHVNLIGYHSAQTAMKSADLYMWLGDGGFKNYKPFEGKKVTLVEASSGRQFDAGSVKFWKKSAKEYGNWNLTKSDVWTCDFSSFTRPGTYRLSVEGIGCSPEFKIAKNIYAEPFKTSLRGFYYMRIGEPKSAGNPPPRQPQFLPGKDPVGFTVYLTTYGPWHPDWKKKGGDQWDNIDWSMYKEPGNPTNPNAYGGHSDALDWDRHAGHISIIWDMLFPYILSNGKGGNDNLGIRESGNRVPDAIDEAQNEVDFWLRLRDTKGGYALGLNNPTKDLKVMYQAIARPYMAWANAANCAMMANAYKIAGNKKQTEKYRDEAVKAWNFANDQDLDISYSIGNGAIRGRDMKAMAAAFLYNVTGDTAYENALAMETVIKGPTSDTEDTNKHNQLWGTAAYLLCAKYKWQPIHYPSLLANMKASVLNEAMKKNVANTNVWPSRRSTDNAFGWFQSISETQRVCVAHAISTDPTEQQTLLRAMILEADYTLGRNPMNMVQMTGLGSRAVGYIYTSGRNDGVPGSHPGHTPYMNSEPWGENFMANPRWYSSKGYPDWSDWPQGEALWNAPYCYSNNEFTPQQSMRGKHCLYGYLYSLGDK
jgi:endoglucanase